MRLCPKAGTTYVYAADYHEWGASANPKANQRLQIQITFMPPTGTGYEAKVSTVGPNPHKATLQLTTKGQTIDSKSAGWLATFGLADSIDLIPLPEPPVRLHNYWQESIDLDSRFPVLRPILKEADYDLTQTSEDIRQNYKTVDIISSLDDFLPSGKGASGPVNPYRLHVSESDHLYLDSEDGMPLIADRRVHIQLPGKFEVNSEATLTRILP